MFGSRPAPKPMKPYYQLREAEDAIPVGDSVTRVWAGDRKRNDGTFGKFFVVATPGDMFRGMQAADKFHW